MENEFLTQSDLLNLGWTKTMIAKILPAPVLKNNPRYGNAAPMKLWKSQIVQEIMQSEDYKLAAAKAEKRKNAARQAAETKAAQNRAAISEICKNIKIEVVGDEELREMVAQAQQYRHDSFGDYYFCIEDVDEATMNRWVVNFIRHNLVDYDYILNTLRGKVGKQELYTTYKGAILQRIAELYPKYAAECERQKLASFMRVL